MEPEVGVAGLPVDGEVEVFEGVELVAAFFVGVAAKMDPQGLMGFVLGEF